MRSFSCYFYHHLSLESEARAYLVGGATKRLLLYAHNCWIENRWGQRGLRIEDMWSPLLRADLTSSHLHVSQGVLNFTQATVLKSGLPFFFRKNLKAVSILPASTSQCEAFPQGLPKVSLLLVFPGGTVVKNPPANAGDMGSSPGLGSSHIPRSN